MKLLFIEALRGAAILLVVMTHVAGDDFVANHQLYGILKPFGVASVDFFFALSGFIIPYASLGKTGSPSRLLDYVRRRFIRIYPTYWIVSSTTLITALAIPHLAELPQFSAHALISSFLILPQAIRPLLPVAWTLEHEMVFYVLFGIFVANHRLGIAAFALWSAYVLQAKLFGTTFGLLEIFYSWHNVYFFIGLAAVLAVKGRTIPDIPVPRPLVVLGLSSYSIYLVHLNAMVFLNKILTRMPINEWLVFATLTVGAVAAGIVFHLFVERPLLTFLRHKTSGKRGRVSRSVLGADRISGG